LLTIPDIDNLNICTHGATILNIQIYINGLKLNKSPILTQLIDGKKKNEPKPPLHKKKYFFLTLEKKNPITKKYHSLINISLVHRNKLLLYLIDLLARINFRPELNRADFLLLYLNKKEVLSILNE
jgi:hypothetical protein